MPSTPTGTTYSFGESLGKPCSTPGLIWMSTGVEDEPQTGQISLIDFELAGFFPKAWIRTKLKASWAFDLNESTNLDPKLYRHQMEKMLEP
ncbi:hypothetical protein AOQ84DRAFT_384138 [Glonium stellatum]|uniref:Uncharacterized protein n=1 Tax=Glonium stellatum TaxID=574774 RepID=A0A8E2K014_9PEZI|nr:hypothetical protein AOQ84DRAFT_384138 [Glonium stellatum]